MKDGQLSWKHVFCYAFGISLSAILLDQNLPPGYAAVPAILIWVMIHGKPSDGF